MAVAVDTGAAALAEAAWRALAEVTLAMEAEVTSAMEDVTSLAAGFTTTALVARITRHTAGHTPARTEPARTEW